MLNKLKYETLQVVGAVLLIASMIAGFVLVGAMIEDNRQQLNEYKEAVNDIAEDCIYTRSQLVGGTILDTDLEHCNQLVSAALEVQ